MYSDVGIVNYDDYKFWHQLKIKPRILELRQSKRTEKSVYFAFAIVILLDIRNVYLIF